MSKKLLRFHFLFNIEHLSTKWPNLELNPIVHVVGSLGSLPPLRKGQVSQWHQVHEEHVGVNRVLEAPASTSDGLQSVVVGKPDGKAQQQIETHRVEHSKRHPGEHNFTCRNDGR